MQGAREQRANSSGFKVGGACNWCNARQRTACAEKCRCCQCHGDKLLHDVLVACKVRSRSQHCDMLLFQLADQLLLTRRSVHAGRLVRVRLTVDARHRFGQWVVLKCVHKKPSRKQALTHLLLPLCQVSAATPLHGLAPINELPNESSTRISNQ